MSEGGERRSGHRGQNQSYLSRHPAFPLGSAKKGRAPLYRTSLKLEGAHAGLPGAGTAHPGEVREQSRRGWELASITPPTQPNSRSKSARARRGRGTRFLALAKAPGAHGAPEQVNGTTRGSRSYQSINLFALTSSLSPYPGGVLAANVFHKVQSDKKPRKQSQLHSNPLRVRLLLFVGFVFSFP